MRYLPFFLFLLPALLAPTGFGAFALKLSPFKVSVVMGKGTPTQVFRVENNTDEPAAVQVGVRTWSMTPEGQEENQDAENDFMVFPAQLVLAPRESRAVRVQYMGEAPAREKAYRLVAEQMAVRLQDTPDNGSAVRFMLRFKGALYITPPGAVADVRVETAVIDAGSLRLSLSNEGTAHALMQNPVLTLRLPGGGTKVLQGDALKGLAGENMHAGARRIFTLPLAGGPPSAKAVDAELSFEKGF